MIIHRLSELMVAPFIQMNMILQFLNVEYFLLRIHLKVNKSFQDEEHLRWFYSPLTHRGGARHEGLGNTKAPRTLKGEELG